MLQHVISCEREMFRLLVSMGLILATISVVRSQADGGRVDFNHARPTVMPRFDGQVVSPPMYAPPPKYEEPNPGYSAGSVGNGKTKPAIVAPASK